jgi:hypothetical protein
LPALSVRKVLLVPLEKMVSRELLAQLARLV